MSQETPKEVLWDALDSSTVVRYSTEGIAHTYLLYEILGTRKPTFLVLVGSRSDDNWSTVRRILGNYIQ